MFGRQALILIILLAATGAVVFWLVWPAYNQVAISRQELASWEGKVKDALATAGRLETLAKDYQASESEVERVYLSLPKGEDLPGLLVQFGALSQNNGLILESIGFSKLEKAAQKRVSPLATEDVVPGGKAATVGPAAPAPTVSPAAERPSQPAPAQNTVRVSLALTGSVSSFSHFLKAVENNLRLMDAAAVSFTTGGQEKVSASQAASKAESIKFSLALDVYYR